MAGNKPGPVGKGDRYQLSIRVPRRHYLRYAEEARLAGLALGDYVALVMARAHDLEDPDYLQRGANQLSLVLPGLSAAPEQSSRAERRAAPAA